MPESLLQTTLGHRHQASLGSTMVEDVGSGKPTHQPTLPPRGPGLAQCGLLSPSASLSLSVKWVQWLAVAVLSEGGHKGDRYALLHLVPLKM